MNRGFSLLEVVIAASLVGGVVVFASSTMQSMTSAGHHGATQLEAVISNQRPLLYIANDLQAASSDTDPETGLARYRIETGATVIGLRDKTTDTDGLDDGYVRVSGDATVEQTVADNLDTAEERFDEGLLGTGLDRARDIVAPSHSILTFVKVKGYTVDPETGEVGPIWSQPITYSVNEQRQLTRLEEGQERIIGRNVTLFHVATDNLGNFIVTLVTEQHDSRTGGVLQVANRIEVHPKNH